MKNRTTPAAVVGVTILLCIGLFTLSSCKKEIQAPNITEWETFQDPVYGTEMEYPKGWLLNSDPKRTRVYSSQAVADKFYEVYAQGSTVIGEENGGVEIELTSEKFKDAGVGTLEEYKAKLLTDFKPLNLGNEQSATLGKDEGAQFSFKVKVGKETTMEGKKIVVAHDSAFYTLTVTGFNEYFAVYQPVFDRMIGSVKLPKPKQKITDPNEASKPSAERSKFTNDFIEFEYPDNFEATPAKELKGGAIFALHLEGLRKDCTVDLDIFPSKSDKGELKFERFFEDNKSKFKTKSSGDATVDGITAKYIIAAPATTIDRKVYFVGKGERLYRIILTWYKPMTADFQPAFESIVTSMKLK